MNSVFYDAIKIKVANLQGNNFHNFIDELFLIGYKNYVPIKQKHDKGCDGIIENRMVLAIYAPENYVLKEFKRKITEDFQSYRKNWYEKYPEWRVIFNGELTASQITIVKELYKTAEPFGSKEIMRFIKDLKWSQKRKIAQYLTIDEKLYVNDILEQIIEDLINYDSSDQIEYPQRDPALYIEDKIELNYSVDDIEAAKNQYLICLEYFRAFENLLKSYEDDWKKLMLKVVSDYNTFQGDFKDRLELLVQKYSSEYPKDDDYISFVRVVLIYLFERCLIGKKTKAESL